MHAKEVVVLILGLIMLIVYSQVIVGQSTNDLQFTEQELQELSTVLTSGEMEMVTQGILSKQAVEEIVRKRTEQETFELAPTEIDNQIIIVNNDSAQEIPTSTESQDPPSQPTNTDPVIKQQPTTEPQPPVVQKNESKPLTREDFINQTSPELIQKRETQNRTRAEKEIIQERKEELLDNKPTNELIKRDEPSREVIDTKEQPQQERLLPPTIEEVTQANENIPNQKRIIPPQVKQALIKKPLKVDQPPVQQELVEEKIKQSKALDVPVENTFLPPPEPEVAFAKRKQQALEKLYVEKETATFKDEETNEDISIVSIQIKPIIGAELVEIYEDIPKEIAQDASQLIFYTDNVEIVDPDPLIVWRFDELNEPVELTYGVKGQVNASKLEKTTTTVLEGRVDTFSILGMSSTEIMVSVSILVAILLSSFVLRSSKKEVRWEPSAHNKLSQYIAAQLNQGRTREDITQNLLGHGWDKNQVTMGFSMVRKR